MKTLPRIAVAFSTVGLAGLIFIQMHDTANARSAAGASVLVAQTVSTTVAPPLVNLPDFSRLVERAGPAVVNIEAIVGKDGASRVAQSGPGGDDAQQQKIGSNEIEEEHRFRWFHPVSNCLVAAAEEHQTEREGGTGCGDIDVDLIAFSDLERRKFVFIPLRSCQRPFRPTRHVVMKRVG